MNIDKKKIIKMLAILTLLCVAVFVLTSLFKRNSMSLQEYAQQHPELAYMKSKSDMDKETEKELKNESSDSEQLQADNLTTHNSISSGDKLSEVTENLQNEDTIDTISALIGASLNGDGMIEQRITYEKSFYYEPLSDNLRRYITGVSFLKEDDLAISYDTLRYVHILHYDFDGNPAEGELICNAAIAQDLVEIFYELYLNEYQLEKVRLIDEYDGDDIASMEDNNTSCFNYRVVEGTTSLSKHALGLALDINPLYNPYITYTEDGGEKVSPASALPYADRETRFPYKIDENDLCYKLFTQRGFTWGGNWNSCKDYQHFQKSLED